MLEFRVPALKQHKYECFAQAVARGISPGEAYTSAGYSKKGARQSAQRLLKKPAVRLRIDEIRAELQKAVNERIISGEAKMGAEIPLATRDEQVRIKSERHQALLRIVKARAEYFKSDNPYLAKVVKIFGPNGLPGVDTGFLILRIESVAGMLVCNLELDGQLLRELSALERDIARLMGFETPIMSQKSGDVNSVQVITVMQCEADLEGED